MMLHVHAPTFTIVRHALALALALKKDCTITVDESIWQHTHYSRTLNALVQVLQNLSVQCSYTNNIITIHPKPLQPFTATITLHPFCPITDIFLTLAPTLLHNAIQSEIIFHGVTHCQYAPSTGFIRFGLAPLLAQFGCYIASATKKFGFYTATGTVATKVYPSYPKQIGAIAQHTRITGIRIYIANIDQEFAFYQKKELCRALSLSDDTVSIMQVANVTNHGNAIDVFFTTGDIPSMLSFTMPLYDDTGNFVFDDAMMQEFLHNIITTCLQSFEYIPPPVVQEALPFLIASGIDYNVAEMLQPHSKSVENYRIYHLFYSS
ncbi:MAG: hypothetical protein N3F66_11720 [Spirochaetes bacterium]|nr:hypothetical protein [Spirochaetota bacterium]